MTYKTNTIMNILNILKDKPKGTKLYSPIFGECKLADISDTCINIINGNYYYIFDEKGKYTSDGESLLFPSKEMRDWSKFSWKKGDVLVNADGNRMLFSHWLDNTYTSFAGKHNTNKCSDVISRYFTREWMIETNPRTKDKFIHDIELKFNGKLNLSTFKIEEQPEFKDGDIVFVSSQYLVTDHPSLRSNSVITVFKRTYHNETENEVYEFYPIFMEARIQYIYEKRIRLIDIKIGKLRPATDYEKQQFFDALAKERKVWNSETKQLEDLPKEHIFKPFDRVLVRDDVDEPWRVDIFRYPRDFDNINQYQCITGNYKYCIFYKGNEHLCDTSNSPTE